LFGLSILRFIGCIDEARFLSPNAAGSIFGADLLSLSVGEVVDENATCSEEKEGES
jgi:hypothetical protein